MKVKPQFPKCMGIMLGDPTTVLSDNVCMFLLGETLLYSIYKCVDSTVTVANLLSQRLTGFLVFAHPSYSVKCGP